MADGVVAPCGTNGSAPLRRPTAAGLNGLLGALSHGGTRPEYFTSDSVDDERVLEYVGISLRVVPRNWLRYRAA